MNNQWFSKIAVWLVIALVLFTVFKSFDHGAAQGKPLQYSEFLDKVRSKQISSVIIQEGSSGIDITAKGTDDLTYHTNGTLLDRGLTGDLLANNVKFDVKPREEPSLLTSLLLSWAPMLLLIGVWV